ncbi:hypothetical protein DFH08DRAFT_513608 [Mycena albidolilacea]|uniref:Uncharacterized protein n=1 Tax=Mycena albidolilacea TaxID=1033008 RepID=A0AAD6Z4U1_9AGAR|nr:hypothetical protein DFH08DRAFT_513608 [Mycena albidolilacea]
MSVQSLEEADRGSERSGTGWLRDASGYNGRRASLRRLARSGARAELARIEHSRHEVAPARILPPSRAERRRRFDPAGLGEPRSRSASIPFLVAQRITRRYGQARSRRWLRAAETGTCAECGCGSSRKGSKPQRDTGRARGRVWAGFQTGCRARLAIDLSRQWPTAFSEGGSGAAFKFGSKFWVETERRAAKDIGGDRNRTRYSAAGRALTSCAIRSM